MPRIPPGFAFDWMAAIVCSDGVAYHERRGRTTVAEFGVLDRFAGAWVELQHRNASSHSSERAHGTGDSLRPTTLVLVDVQRGDTDTESMRDWLELCAREGSTVDGVQVSNSPGTVDLEANGRVIIDASFIGARPNRDLQCGCGKRLTLRHERLGRLLDACRVAQHSTIELSMLVEAVTARRLT